MEKHFVNYNQSLALKELGFDEPCLMYIDDEEDLINDDTAEWIGTVKAPLKSQVFEWFRKLHKIEAVVACYYSKILDIPYEERLYHCYIVRDGITTKGPKFKKYEEAESSCIDKLIKIVKDESRVS